MAGSLAAVKKEMRKSIKDKLKRLSVAAITFQCMGLNSLLPVPRLTAISYRCHVDVVLDARVQGSTADQRVLVHAHWRD